MSSAIKNDLLHMDEIKQVTHVMTTLNKIAAECMNQFQVHAATDVTGFGLLGHAAEMARESSVGIQIIHDQVPVLPRTRKLAEDGVIPGGTKNNLKHVEDMVTFTKPLDQIDQWILADAVTSGGLLLSVDNMDAEKLKAELQKNGVDAQIIGEVMRQNSMEIIVE
jgi:selenide,water dikinase